jgi:hypothetical protein
MEKFTVLCKMKELPPGSMKGFPCGDLDVLAANVAGAWTRWGIES